MPRTVKYVGTNLRILTEAELLAVANRLRAAGGANVLEALLPSRPMDSSRCLIANALNFECEVLIPDEIDGKDNYAFPDQWAMTLPENMSEERREALAEAMGWPLARITNDVYEEWGLLLPLEVGNSARAFDARIAFKRHQDRS